MTYQIATDSTTKKGKKKAKKSKNLGSLKPLRRTNSRDGTECRSPYTRVSKSKGTSEQRGDELNQQLSLVTKKGWSLNRDKIYFTDTIEIALLVKNICIGNLTLYYDFQKWIRTMAKL